MNRTMTEHEIIALPEAVETVERYLDTRTDDFDLPENLRDAIRYALLGGGKRLRPVLAIFSGDAVGARREDVLPGAAALELIHAFSLVHDDLPAMDDDDLRRGRPTLHIHAGEAMAILAGDAMMALAFELISHSPLDDARARAVSRELGRGTTGMIAGQVYDTLGGFPDGLTAEQRLDLIHRNKTGALIRAACRIGAIAGGASPAELASVTQYGEHIGLMFQIVDDVLDVTQSAQHLGKATGKDETAGKLTWPGLLGVEKSREAIAELERQALDAVAALGEPAEPLRELCRYLAVRTR